VLAELTAAVELFGDALSGLDPSLLSGVDCASVVESLAKVEKRSAAVRVVAAAREAACGAHRDRGFSDPSTWLAHTAGVTDSEARAALAAVAKLDSAPLTAEALRAGDLSLAQAAEITKTETAAPGSEADLLDLAVSSSVAGLRHAARTRRFAAEDPEKARTRRHRERYFRHWLDDHGMIRISGAFTPEVGVPLANRIDTETDRVARAANKAATGDTSAGSDGEVPEAEREPWECLAADAVAKLILEGGTPIARNAELVLVCDISAFQRGHTHPGEVCHIVGFGPVAVSVARDVALDGFIKAVLHDGVTIGTVAHFGRHINAELRTALGLGDPPTFEGAVCTKEGCDRRYHLQFDHRDPVAHRGPTTFENLEPLCRPHHAEKTDRDRRAGLLTPDPDDGPEPFPP